MPELPGSAIITSGQVLLPLDGDDGTSRNRRPETASSAHQFQCLADDHRL